MLNLDTEEWGSFYIGCAGGIDYDIQGSLTLAKPAWKAPVFLKILVSGFLGGHSGVDIHEQRGNAIKFLTEILHELPASDLMVHEIRAGKAHNIIPRDAWSTLSLEKSNLAVFKKAISTVSERWKSFLPLNDQGVSVQIEEHDEIGPGVTGLELQKMLGFLLVFPHGAHKYDLASQRELVSLSNNLALCYLVGEKFYVLTSLRFFDRQECVALEAQVQTLALMSDFKATKNDEYPSWKPVRENKLLEQVGTVYQRLHGKAAKVTAIHAGLECGILREKIGPIDAVSFGPTIMGAHSPDERVEVNTVEKFWNLLTHVLAEI
jgi:dipeptidase D